jgi:hypothetical protein
MLLEHQAEAPTFFEPVDLRAKVGLQSRVLDLVEEDVKFASDHAVRLPAWSALADRAS